MLTVTRFADLAGTEKVGFTQYTWNGNRLMRIQHQDGDENVLADFDYDYDLGLRLTFKDDNGIETDFGYDETNQLTSAGDNEYSFDLAGNRSEDMGYFTGTGNRLAFDGTWYYFYDAEGNLIEKNQGPTEEAWTYEYDHLNRLISIKHWADMPECGPWQGLIGQWDYVYDVFGNRIQEDAAPGYLSPTTTTKFAYLGMDAWADFDGEYDLQARRVYLDGVDQLLARIDSRGVAWYLTDHLGSVRGATDDTGALQASITFDEFGNPGDPSGPDVTYLDRYGFTAREFDADTGLQYNRARFYDPMTGRWISEDPIFFVSGDPNFYRYVGNGPVNAVDPWGLFNQEGAWNNLPEEYQRYWYKLRAEGWTLSKDDKGEKRSSLPWLNASNSVYVYESDWEARREAGTIVEWRDREWGIDYTNKVIYIDAFKNASAARFTERVLDRIMNTYRDPDAPWTPEGLIAEFHHKYGEKGLKLLEVALKHYEVKVESDNDSFWVNAWHYDETTRTIKIAKTKRWSTPRTNEDAAGRLYEALEKHFEDGVFAKGLKGAAENFQTTQMLKLTAKFEKEGNINCAGAQKALNEQNAYLTRAGNFLTEIAKDSARACKESCVKNVVWV